MNVTAHVDELERVYGLHGALRYSAQWGQGVAYWATVRAEIERRLLAVEQATAKHQEEVLGYVLD